MLESHTQIVNEQLGLNGVDARRLMHQVLFDVLCTVGTGWTVMGYDAATVPTPMEMPSGPPQNPPGAILGLGAQTQPTETQMVPVPIYEECFWRYLSPFQVLRPSTFRSTIWDDAPWLAYEFEIPVRIAKRKGWVTDKYQGGPSDNTIYADHGTGTSSTDAVAKGVVLWYKSATYRDDIVHPLHLTYLVLMDSVDQPAEHKNSPYQTLDDKGGLTPDSLIGHPIHPFTIRSLTDASYVPSDCTVSRPLVNELNKFREQMIEYREACILRWMYNTDTLPREALDKIVRSPIGGFIGVPGEAFVGDGSIKELPHGTYPRENFTFNDYVDNDLARTHALDANQAGAANRGDKTATESQIQQSNINARLGLERENVLSRYCAGVTKFSTLLQRFWTVEQAAKIVGQQAAGQWDTWRKSVPAALAFTAMPDSTLRTDLAWDRKRAMDEYSFFANDPFINRMELLKQLLPKLHYTSKVLQEQPPSPHPPEPKISLAIASADLTPLSPSYANVYQILTQQGVQNLTPPIAVAPPVAQPGLPPPMEQPAHGGKVAQMESLSKHAQDLTGGMQATGQPKPVGVM